METTDQKIKSVDQRDQRPSLPPAPGSPLVVHVGDCREILQCLPSESVQCCVTSPPYFGLRDYGHEGQIGLEETPNAYVDRLVEVFREVRRVLRDDGTAWVNLGDSYNAHPGQRKVTDKAGEKQQTNRGAPGAPSRHVAALKPKDLIGIPWRVAFALQADGWYLRQDIIWHKPNPMPESVTDRCTKAHEYIFLLSKNPRYYFDQASIKVPAALASLSRWNQEIELQEGSSRANGGAKTNGPMKAVGGPLSHKGSKFHTGKTGNHQLGRSSTNPRVTGNLPGRDDNGKACNGPGQEMVNRRSVWTVTTKPYKDAHFATFPKALITPCILAGSKPGDLILDPFAGSGTTGEVALELGRRAELIELNPEYAKLIEKRTNVTMGLALA